MYAESVATWEGCHCRVRSRTPTPVPPLRSGLPSLLSSRPARNRAPASVPCPAVRARTGYSTSPCTPLLRKYRRCGARQVPADKQDGEAARYT